jgi:tetrahedral aminopeptidase
MTDECSVSRLGSLHGLKRGQAKGALRKSILLAAHMDVIGLIVTSIRDGWIFFDQIGGIDDRILPGMSVIVHGRKDLPGIIAKPPDHLMPPDHQAGHTIEKQYLMIDTGFPPEEVPALVRTGDMISFTLEPMKLSGETICSPGLDDRAAVAAITFCLSELQRIHHDWDVWFVATTQEEETLGGASTSTFQIRPDIAIAIDVTFAKQYDVTDYHGQPLGKGPTLGVGANTHPALFKSFKEIAEKLDIPYNLEICPVFSGTDAEIMQLVAEGIPTLVLGIPTRYLHSAVELTSIKDIERTGRLLAEFIRRLESDYMQKIVWDE